MLDLIATNPNFVWVILGAVLLGISSGLIGVVFHLKKSALISDVLAHAALPGVALTFLFLKSTTPLLMLIGALCSCSLAYYLVEKLVNDFKIKRDSAFAIILTFFFACGGAAITYLQKTPAGAKAGLDRLLFGQAGAIVRADLEILIVVSLLVVLFYLCFARKLKQIIFDPEFSKVQGTRLHNYELIIAFIAITLIAFGLQMVGAVLIAAMLIIPPAIARLWIVNFYSLLIVSAIFGAFSAIIGVVISANFAGQPTGPWIILIAGLLFFVSYFIAPTQGIISQRLRRSKLKVRIDQENILRTIYRSSEDQNAVAVFKPVQKSDLMIFRDFSLVRLNYLLKKLQWQGLIKIHADAVELTSVGLEQARKLTAGHRLWESYLAAFPGDSAFWHAEADQVEHFLTKEQKEEIIAQLESADLDPHGKVIPRDYHND